MYHVAILIVSCHSFRLVSNIFRLFRAFSLMSLESRRVQTPRLRSRHVLGQELWPRCIRMHVVSHFAFPILVFCALCDSLVHFVAFLRLFWNSSILHAFSPFLSWSLTLTRGLDRFSLHLTSQISLHHFWWLRSACLLCQSAVPWCFSSSFVGLCSLIVTRVIRFPRRTGYKCMSRQLGSMACLFALRRVAARQFAHW
jgi:hypothetical protein